MMTTSKAPVRSQNVSQEDKEVQTVIKVYPFMLLPYTPRASVTSDKKFCTVLSLETSKESIKFYNLLQYCPFHDIEEHSERVIDLPRKTKLQWVAHNILSEEDLKEMSLADDDGVSDMCSDLLVKLGSGRRSLLRDADTQTDLMVRPFLVEDPNVATVFRNTMTQSVPVACGTNSTRRSVMSNESSN